MSVAITREPLPPTLALPADGPPAPPAEPPAAEEPSAFTTLLRSLASEMRRGESLTRATLGAAGADQAIGPAELIALQAGIYRYGEAVDLASRLIDRATSAVKTVVQGT